MSRSSLIHLVALVVSLGAMACSSSGTTPEGGSSGQSSGGMPSSGGKTGSGGTGAGGTAGGSGQTGEGGKSATGGSSGSGGSAPSGGSPASGGSPSSGGSPASGGTSGATGGSSAAGTAGGLGTGGAAAGAGGRATGGGGPGGGGGSAGAAAGGGSGGHAGGTAGSAAGGASGGGGGYNPCKASPCVILPLGDSITHGFSSTDDAGYRSALFKLIVAANQNVTFIGSLSNGPTSVSSKTFPKNHEGHDGISVSGITGYVPPAKSFSTTPHIVLLHIGTNDMTSNADPTTTANQLSTLLTNLVNAAPDALIVVAKIIPLGYSNGNYTSYVAKIADVVKAQAGKHVVTVDMSTLPMSDIRGSGNVHPTDQGYVDMANLWYGAIKGYLPQ